MSTRPFRCCLGAVLLQLGAQSWAAGPVPEALIEQAHYWQQRGASPQEYQAWQRVLGLDANHAEALGRIVVLEAQRGNQVESQRYLRRLQDSGAGESALRRTYAELQMYSPGDGGPLDRARALARNGRHHEAVAEYRKLFGGRQPPNDELALEYYETLAGTSGGWREAHDGLATVIQRRPGPKAELAYARVLSYRGNTRRDAISRLQKLAASTDGELHREALVAWRKSLLWLMPLAGDEALYRAYLKGAGSDAQITAKLSEIRRNQARLAQVDPVRDAALERAFGMLDDGAVARAESEFGEVLSRNDGDGEALAGMAVLRLKQGQYTEALSYFDRAFAREPSLARRYRDAVASAKLWQRLQQAERLVEEGRLEPAEREYAAAVAAAPAGALDPGIEQAYADVLLRLGKTGAARTRLEAALQRHPRDPRLLASLATAVVRLDDIPAAERLLAQMPEQSAASTRAVRADIARFRAREALDKDDLAEADRRLRAALLLQPDDPWIRLDLARLYRRMGWDSQADSLLQTLVEVAGDDPQAWYAEALALAELGRWYESLLSLEKLDVSMRTPSVRALQKRAWTRYQIERAAQLARAGDKPAAVALIEAVSQVAGLSGEYATALAGAWAEAGEPSRALSAMRRAFSHGSETPDGAARLQYAALLLQLQQDADFELVAAELVKDETLSEAQHARLEDLVVGYRIRIADRARERGDLAESYGQLREVVARYPDQPRVQQAMIRLFVDGGEQHRAFMLAEQMMQQPQADHAGLLTAIDAALAAGEADAAARWIQAGFDRGESSVDLHTAAARLEEQQGHAARALKHYREAQRLASANGGAAGVSGAPPVLAMMPAYGGGIAPLPAPVPEGPTSDGPPRDSVPGFAPPPTLAPPPAPLMPRALTPPGPERAESPPAVHISRAISQNANPEVPPSSGTFVAKAAWQPPGSMSTPVPRRAPELSVDTTPDPIQRLRASVSGWFQADTYSRGRQGESGTSSLFDQSFLLDLVSPAADAGRFGLRLRPTFLDAGALSVEESPRFGSYALSGTAPAEREQHARGVAFNLSYARGAFAADVGTTPLGFRFEDVVGGLRWRPTLGTTAFRFELLRRSVNDSLLSYAGAYDGPSQTEWGGLIRTGGRMQAVRDFGRNGLYAGLGAYQLSGHEVLDNAQFEFNAGTFFRWVDEPGIKVTLGANLTVMGYRRNQRYFTLGHGGYFSPQLFTAVSLPLQISGRRDAFEYFVDLSLGLQRFEEDAADVYPTQPALQAALSVPITGETGDSAPFRYGSRNVSSLGYRMQAALQYRPDEHWIIGARLSLDNARDYEELILMFYLRWYFAGGPQGASLTALPTQVDAAL